MKHRPTGKQSDSTARIVQCSSSSNLTIAIHDSLNFLYFDAAVMFMHYCMSLIRHQFLLHKLTVVCVEFTVDLFRKIQMFVGVFSLLKT